MFKVRSKPCDTCIYRQENYDRLNTLEEKVKDPHFEGHFVTYRTCHHHNAEGICCRGFWNRHKDHFDIGQLAQRCDAVEYV